ncbi:hypothetical protein FACS1894218_6420 [Bacilli bacterium]|nr:hypothetical protein FACS1894218_6420 [Bacilli bacterium]
MAVTHSPAGYNISSTPTTVTFSYYGDVVNVVSAVADGVDGTATTSEITITLDEGIANLNLADYFAITPLTAVKPCGVQIDNIAMDGADGKT